MSVAIAGISAENRASLAFGERVARELVVALRGRRSRLGLSRRLGYRSNIVRRWEAGECFPTAAAFSTTTAGCIGTAALANAAAIVDNKAVRTAAIAPDVEFGFFNFADSIGRIGSTDRSGR